MTNSCPEALSWRACRFQQRMAIALQPAELSTVQADGLVHFGDLVQLCSAHTPAVLACDVEDRVSHTVPFAGWPLVSVCV